MLEILSKTNKKTSELLEGITNYYSTEELKFKSPDDVKAKVVEQIINYCKEKNYECNTIDGVRATFDDGWALVRYSNTGPNITARFEATTKERLEELKEEFIGLVNKFNV